MNRIAAYAAIGLILLALAGLGLALVLNRPSKPPVVPKSSREHFKPVGRLGAMPASADGQPGRGSSRPAA